MSKRDTSEARIPISVRLRQIAASGGPGVTHPVTSLVLTDAADEIERMHAIAASWDAIPERASGEARPGIEEYEAEDRIINKLAGYGYRDVHAPGCLTPGPSCEASGGGCIVASPTPSPAWKCDHSIRFVSPDGKTCLACEAAHSSCSARDRARAFIEAEAMTSDAYGADIIVVGRRFEDSLTALLEETQVSGVEQKR